MSKVGVVPGLTCREEIYFINRQDALYLFSMYCASLEFCTHLVKVIRVGNENLVW